VTALNGLVGITAVRLASPGRLWLLVALVGLVAVYVGALQRRRRNTVRFTNLELLDSIAPRRPGWRRHLVFGLILVTFVFGIVASAQPYREERVAGERSIIVLTLDVSLSMLADDVDPSRFEAAKEAAKDFVDQVDRSIDIGLVTFSLDVRTKVLPTLDRGKVIDAIDALTLDQGTNIGGAIEGAVDVIIGTLETDADGTPLTQDGRFPAAIVVLSDGETVEGGTPGQEGAVAAAEVGVPVYGIAFGTPEGVVTLEDPATGDVVEQPVPVKYEELTEAAVLTGGQFFRAEDEGALRDAYADIEQNLGSALKVPEPERVDISWQYVLVALAVLFVAVLLSMWWLGGLV
jgi:Ca-activated chloride channel homolog